MIEPALALGLEVIDIMERVHIPVAENRGLEPNHGARRLEGVVEIRLNERLLEKVSVDLAGGDKEKVKVLLSLGYAELILGLWKMGNEGPKLYDLRINEILKGRNKEIVRIIRDGGYSFTCDHCQKPPSALIERKIL